MQLEERDGGKIQSVEEFPVLSERPEVSSIVSAEAGYFTLPW